MELDKINMINNKKIINFTVIIFVIIITVLLINNKIKKNVPDTTDINDTINGSKSQINIEEYQKYCNLLSRSHSKETLNNEFHINEKFEKLYQILKNKSKENDDALINIVLEKDYDKCLNLNISESDKNLCITMVKRDPSLCKNFPELGSSCESRVSLLVALESDNEELCDNIKKIELLVYCHYQFEKSCDFIQKLAT